MSTIFEKIMNGALPGEFIWEDDSCVAIMTIEPVAPGHALVIPRDPVDKWTDLPATTLDHLMQIAQKIGKAQEEVFQVPRSAVVIAGFEVPHTHIHVIPAETEQAASLALAKPATPEELEQNGKKLREHLGEKAL